MFDKIDIGNVRGIQGERGEKGERGRTPSYEDIRYKKVNDHFVTIVTDGEITATDYYLDANGHLCNSEGYLYDNNGNLTSEIGVPFDFDEYGYYYQRLYMDDKGRYTNSKGEILDENFKVQYVPSDFISDILSYLFQDEDGYGQLVGDIYPHVVDTLVSADPNDVKYKAFFDAIEGDIKYYICLDDPEYNIRLDENNNLINTCKYLDENGNTAMASNGGYAYVPLEKNALYLYNNSGLLDNDIMHYDIYVCTKANTVPIKLVSSADFKVDYNVIDGLTVTTTDENHDEENEVWLNIITRGTRGQFYSMFDVDTLFDNNVISKLGANNGIAQLNGSGKVPASQLPAYVDDVVEGTMNSNMTVFTPKDNDYIDSVKQTGKIYVDTNTRKTYRWTGSSYIFISNPVVVDDDSTTAFASVNGKALETKMGTGSFNTTAKTVVGAINEHESDINSINNNKQDKTDNGLNTTAKTVVGAINEHESDISLINNSKQDKTDNGLNTTAKTIVGAINELKAFDNTVNDSLSIAISELGGVDVVQDGNPNPVTSNAVYDNSRDIVTSLTASLNDTTNYTIVDEEEQVQVNLIELFDELTTRINNG